MSSFSLISKYILISLLISPLTYCCLEMWCLISTFFWVFQISSCYWFIISCHVVREHTLYYFYLFKFIEVKINYSIAFCLSWWMFHVELRMGFLLLLGSVFCRSISETWVLGYRLFFSSVLVQWSWRINSCTDKFLQ